MEAMEVARKRKRRKLSREGSGRGGKKGNFYAKENLDLLRQRGPVLGGRKEKKKTSRSNKGEKGENVMVGGRVMRMYEICRKCGRGEEI